jgi:hypothetical protein
MRRRVEICPPAAFRFIGGSSMIAGAAIYDEGTIYIGKNYSDIVRNMDVPWKAMRHGDRGFVTEKGEFMDPEEAAVEAFNYGQIAQLKSILLPEDLA